MRQQARSSVFICASGIMQAIAGATHDTSNRTSTPNWRKAFIRRYRILDFRGPLFPHQLHAAIAGPPFQCVVRLDWTGCSEATSQ